MSKPAVSEQYDVLGLGVYIFRETEGGWAVWLNPTSEEEYEGLSIGGGSSRGAAVANAVQSLEAVVDQLQQPAPETK